MPNKKMIKVEVIRKQVEWANNLLASAIPQHAKETICTMVETLLLDCGLYAGFNHVYWTKQGGDEWYDAGCPEFPEKNKFIIGEEGQKHSSTSGTIHEIRELREKFKDFTSDIQGEYARAYYIKKE